MKNPISEKVQNIKPSGIRKFFDIVSENERCYIFRCWRT